MHKICFRENIQILNIDENLPELLSEYWWPGNVRQLENAIFKAIVMCESDTLTLKDFENILTFISKSSTPALVSKDITKICYVSEDEPKFKTLTEHEAEVIEKALEFYNNNISKVSKILGIGRSTLYRKMKEYNIDSNGNVEDINEVRNEKVSG